MRGVKGKKVMMRIFISEQDKYEGEPLWQVIVKKVKEKGLAGATVFRAIAGIGAHSEIKTARILALSYDLPIVVEIIDDEDKINQFLYYLDSIIEEGLITLEKVNVVMYRHRPNGS